MPDQRSPIASSPLHRCRTSCGRGVALLAVIVCACVGLPPGPPQEDGTTAMGETTGTSLTAGQACTADDECCDGTCNNAGGTQC